MINTLKAFYSENLTPQERKENNDKVVELNSKVQAMFNSLKDKSENTKEKITKAALVAKKAKSYSYDYQSNAQIKAIANDSSEDKLFMRFLSKEDNEKMVAIFATCYVTQFNYPSIRGTLFFAGLKTNTNNPNTDQIEAMTDRYKREPRQFVSVLKAVYSTDEQALDILYKAKLHFTENDSVEVLSAIKEFETQLDRFADAEELMNQWKANNKDLIEAREAKTIGRQNAKLEKVAEWNNIEKVGYENKSLQHWLVKPYEKKVALAEKLEKMRKLRQMAKFQNHVKVTCAKVMVHARRLPRGEILGNVLFDRLYPDARKSKEQSVYLE